MFITVLCTIQINLKLFSTDYVPPEMLGAGALPLKITPIGGTTPAPFVEETTTPIDKKARRKNRRRKNRKKNVGEPGESNVENSETETVE